MEITYQVCVGFARKKPKTKQPWLVVLSFPNCGKATTRHELGLVSISSDRSGTYPTRKQLSSDWLRLYFFVTRAITFEKPMRMKKHVQKKIISVLTESFSKEATLACLLCSIVKYITLTRSRICSYFASCHCLRILFFFFLIMSVSSPYSPPHPLKRAARSLALPPVGEWGEETDDILDYRHIWTMISYLPLVPVVLEGREGLGDPKNKNWQ